MPGLNSHTIIFYHQEQGFIITLQGQGDLIGMCVAGDVQERFLGDPQDRHFQPGAQMWEDPARPVKPDMDAVPGLELRQIGMQGGLQTILVQDNGAQIRHHVPDDGDHFGHQLDRVRKADS